MKSYELVLYFHNYRLLQSQKKPEKGGWFGWSAWTTQISESEILKRAEKEMDVIREELAVKIDENG